MTPISIAFVPLTDAAVLIAAKERGFAEAEGIDLSLVRSTSWATARDRLVYGQVQAAHLLAPLAIAVTLGLSQQPAPIAAPFKLGLNGNAMTLSAEFAAALDPVSINRVTDPEATAHDFAGAIGLHRRKPIIGIVHRFSSHALMLRYWLASAGVDPDRDLTLRVLPPSLMVEALRAGEVDGFTVGEPWNSIAVDDGLGEIAAVGASIWQRGVEKVLAMREPWMEANPDAVDRLLRALDHAAKWCDQPSNRQDLATLLAEPDYVDARADLIERGLSGRIWLRREEESVEIPNFFLFHGDAANFPWRSQGLWIYSQFIRWKLLEASADAERRAAHVFRSDVYRRALAGSDTPMPGASMKLEGSLGSPIGVGSDRGTLTLGADRFFDGRVFDPDRIQDYLAGFRR